MKKISVRFEEDKGLDGIEVIVRAASRQDEDVQKLMETVSDRSGHNLEVFDSSGTRCLVDENDIIYVSSNGKQVHIVTSLGFYFVRQRLHNVEELLSSSCFLRISRFEIINLRKVSKYDFTLGGSFRIEFENGMETWASRRYISAVKKRLMEEEGKV